MNILTNIFYFIITFGILVLVHELGHFLAAKFFHMRVDIFSIGFPPRAFGKKIGETDYCISWIPIGGFVKIAGMIDESFDTEFLNHDPQPWEFRSKPMWQRVIVMGAGITMNVLLAVGIFWGINYSTGKTIINTTTVGIVLEQSAAEKAGFIVGDKILAINGMPVNSWDDIQSDVLVNNIGEDLSFKINRNESEQKIFIPHSSIPNFEEEPFGLMPIGSSGVVIITGVEKNRPAAKTSLAINDTILSANNLRIQSAGQLKNVIQSHAGKEVVLRWKHGDSIQSVAIIPDKDGRIGIGLGQLEFTGPKEHYNYSLFEALPVGVKEITDVTVLFGKSMWQVATGKAEFSKTVGGPVKIAQMATRSAELGIISFLAFLGLLSLMLAIINILPFPALDGGHIFFLSFEWIFKREISAKVKLIVNQVGFYLLLAFMIFVIFNDFRNL